MRATRHRILRFGILVLAAYQRGVLAQVEEFDDIKTNRFTNELLRDVSLRKNAAEERLHVDFIIYRPSPFYQVQVELFDKTHSSLTKIVSDELHRLPGEFPITQKDEHGRSPYYRHSWQVVFEKKVPANTLRAAKTASLNIVILPAPDPSVPLTYLTADAKHPLSDTESTAQREELQAVVTRERKQKWSAVPASPGDIALSNVRIADSINVIGSERISDAVVRKNLGNGLLTISLRTTGYQVSPIQYLVVRLFDRNGALLTNTATEQLWRMSHAPPIGAEDPIGFSLYAHVLSFSTARTLQVLDLADATSAELEVRQ